MTVSAGTIRRIGWALAAAGLTLASFTDRIPERMPPRAGAYVVLAADFHVHAFAGDGALGPWDLRREARRRGLDVIAVVNHNQMLTPLLASRVARAPGDVLMIPGQEFTGIGYHMVAAGIRRTIDWRLPPARAIEAVHAQGGIAIAAHPSRIFQAPYDDEALRVLDGVEVFHPAVKTIDVVRVDLPLFFARAQRVRPNIAPIGSSDFHFHGPMGDARTYVLASDFNERAVLDAVRAGRTVVYDHVGRVYGASEWVSLVDPHRQHDRPAGVNSAIAVALALAGLVLLTLT
jgi:predicted metal-dependent phosphoesterase TrpH